MYKWKPHTLQYGVGNMDLCISFITRYLCNIFLAFLRTIEGTNKLEAAYHLDLLRYAEGTYFLDPGKMKVHLDRIWTPNIVTE